MLFGLLLAAALTLEQVFAPEPPWGAQPEHVVWAPSGNSFLYVLPTQEESNPLPVRQFDVHSGQTRVLIDPARYSTKPRTPANVSWSPDGTRVAFTVGGTLYVRDMQTAFDRLIARDVSDALWSPKGDAVAYTSKANVYVARLTPVLHVVQITTGGSDGAILEGELDWVYPEELGIQHGFAWSPSGRYIAYLRLDEREVSNFPIIDFLPAENVVRSERYPLAGGRNPKASLRVADVTDGRDTLAYDAAPQDEYVAAFGWKTKEDALVAEILDRPQRRLRVVEAAPHTSATKAIYEQRSPTWVDVISLPQWLANGTSVWVLDRDGSRKLYLRDASGAFHERGNVSHIFSLLGVDEKTGEAYVSAAHPTRRDRSLLGISLNDGHQTNLTAAAGDNNVSLAPSFTAFLNTLSTLSDPPVTFISDMSGRILLPVTARNEALRSSLQPVELLSVNSPRGALDAYMIKPPGFDAGKKYPVVVYAYGGPAAPTTSNRFGGMRGLYHQLLAQQGFIVFSIDGPASQFGNDAGTRELNRNFGPAALAGQELGAGYLKSLPYVDASRIGIWGWSYGGYLTLYAMTHASSFKAGIAGSPVTDWRFYDSIYTERYMGTPQRESAAYDRSSDIAGAQLHGDVLINHGTADDNVHMSNTIAFLQSAIGSRRTDVDLMLYPRQLHHYSSLDAWRHIYSHMLDWWKGHL